MLSSFSWMRDTGAVSEDFEYVGGSGWSTGGSGVAPPRSASNINPEQHIVRGYTRSNGTFVAPHVETNPDHDRTNNLSSPGNVNRYTGSRSRR